MISLAHKFVNVGANGYQSDRRPQRDEFLGLNLDSPQAWNLGACFPMWGQGGTEVDLASGYLAYPTNVLTFLDPQMGWVYYGDNGGTPRGGGAPARPRYYNIGAFAAGQSGSTAATGYPANMDAGANGANVIAARSCSWTAWIRLASAGGYILQGTDMQGSGVGGNNPPNGYITSCAANSGSFPGPGFGVAQLSSGSNLAVELDIDGGQIQRSIIGFTPINDGLWHHIAGTYEATGTSVNPNTDVGGHMQVYVDGVLDGTETSNTYDVASSVACLESWRDSSPWGTAIGADTDFVNAQWNGMFCDFRFYLGRALTTADLYAMWHPDTRWELYRPRRYYNVWLPAGGNFFTATAADSPATTDSASRLRAGIDAATDAPATVDTAARIASEPRTTTDAPATVDTAAKILSAVGSSSDTPATTETASRLLAALAVTTDGPQTLDSSSRLATEGRTSVDSASTTDAAGRQASEGRTTSDAPQSTDSAVRLALEGRSGVDSPTTVDTSSRAIVEIRTAPDAQTTIDTATRLSTVNRTAPDSPQTTDIAAQQSTHPRTTSDVPATTDTATRLTSALRSVLDAPTTIDTASRSGVFGRISSGTFSTVDTAVAAVGAFTRTATDTASTVDSASRLFVGVRSSIDTLSTLDSATRLFIGVVTTGDAPHTTDATGRLWVGPLSASGAVGTTDEVVDHLAALRLAADVPHTSDIGDRLFVGVRISLDTSQVFDSASAVQGVTNRTAGDLITSLDGALRALQAPVTVDDAVQTLDSPSRLLTLFRVVLDTFGSSDAAVASGSGVIVVSPAGVWEEATRSVIWLADFRTTTWRRSMGVCVKKPGESLVYAFDFSTHAAIKAGDTLSSVISVIPTLNTPGTAVAITLGVATISGTEVQLLISGGQDGEEYALEFTVRTVGNQVPVGLGILDIREGE